MTSREAASGRFQLEAGAMTDYWHKRYLDALAKSDAATCLRVKSAYLDLAEHCRSMQNICGRRTEVEYRHAA
jgi:hypothetical protein